MGVNIDVGDGAVPAAAAGGGTNSSTSSKSDQHHQQQQQQQQLAVATPMLSKLGAAGAGAVVLYLDVNSLLSWRCAGKEFSRTFWGDNVSRDYLQRILFDLHRSRHACKLLGDSGDREEGRRCSSPQSPASASPSRSALSPTSSASSSPRLRKKCLSIGHKGAEGHIPGNTMASFLRAVELGVDMIELDVVLVQNSAILVHHDPMIEETGEWLQSASLARVRKLLPGHPLLLEVLQDQRLRESSVDLYLDLKHTNIALPTMRMLKRAVMEWGWSAERFIVATFTQPDLVEINAYRHSIVELRPVRTVCIIDAVPLALGRDFEALGCHAVSCGKGCASKAFLEDCHRRGLEMWVWTVNSPHHCKLLMDMGVDGVCTDFPDMVAALQDAEQQQHSLAEQDDVEGLMGELSLVARKDALCMAQGSGCRALLAIAYASVLAAEVVEAILEARAMNAYVKLAEKILRGAPLEVSELHLQLAEAEHVAEDFLKPILEAESAWQRVTSYTSSELGCEVLASVQRELAAPPRNAGMLPFEKLFLLRASQQITPVLC
jgi:glycerophosphoryl diester phosphodiesterase